MRCSPSADYLHQHPQGFAQGAEWDPVRGHGETPWRSAETEADRLSALERAWCAVFFDSGALELTCKVDVSASPP